MTRDLRRSIEVLWSLFVACLLSLALSGVNVAYANSNSDELDMSTYLYVVTTDNNNKNDAACEALVGQSYDTLDNGLKTRLFNSEVGGGAGTDTNPNFPDYAYFRDNLRAYYRSSGEYLWYSRLNGFSYSWAFSNAQKDLQAAFRWWDAYGDGVDEPGGGGGVTDDGTEVYIPLTTYAPLETGVEYGDYIRMRKSVYDEIYSGGANSPVIATVSNVTGQSLAKVVVQAPNASRGYLPSWPSGYTFALVSGPGHTDSRAGRNISATNVAVTVVNGRKCYDLYSLGTSAIVTYGNIADMVYKRGGSESLGGGGSNGGGPIPDPDPVNPPDPEPVTPVPDPEPVDPGDNWTTIVNNVYNVTQTHVDLQPVIDAIAIVNQSLQQANRNLNTIDNNLRTGFQALASQFDAWGNWWSQTWTNYTTWQEGWWSWLNQVLEGMRLEFAEYANDIQVWLSMIYNKIGTSVTIRNPNVGDNDETGDLLDDFFEWLAGLVEKLVQLITGDLSGSMSTFADLATRFPFSIPWDLYAVLVMFSHSPVTPVFDLPFTYIGVGLQATTTYVHVDLSDWDYYAEAFRWFSLAIFSVALAWKTPYMIGTLEV